MNKFLPATLAAAAVLVVAILGYNLLPGVSGPGGRSSAPTVPSASPAPLAIGSFISHGAQIELDATGEGSNVTGSMTASDVGGDEIGRFTVDLACTRTTDSGLIVIGGLVTDSANYDEYAPEGSNVAIVLQQGSPVRRSSRSSTRTRTRPAARRFSRASPMRGTRDFNRARWSRSTGPSSSDRSRDRPLPTPTIEAAAVGFTSAAGDLTGGRSTHPQQQREGA